MDAKKIYKALLGLYPGDYRERFAGEMAAAFEESLGELEQHGRSGWDFALVEFAGLLAGAALEWVAKASTEASVRGRVLPDRLRMRPPGVSWEAHYGSAVRTIPEEVRVAEQHVDLLVQRMVYAISHHDFESAREYSNQEREARKNARLLRQRYNLAD
jgi:hypothetical protein